MSTIRQIQLDNICIKIEISLLQNLLIANLTIKTTKYVYMTQLTLLSRHSIVDIINGLFESNFLSN